MYPVYLGFSRIEYTPDWVHPLPGSEGGQAWWSAFSRSVISGIPSRSTVRQVKICATTGARAGSGARRALVRPWAAFTGTGCGIRSAVYPYGGVPMFHPSRACSRSPFQAFSLIWNRYHSATPCFTLRTRIVVAFIPSRSIGSSAASSGMPASASWRSSLSALNVSRPDRSMSSQMTAANLGFGPAASASRSAIPPSRGMPTSNRS